MAHLFEPFFNVTSDLIYSSDVSVNESLNLTEEVVYEWKFPYAVCILLILDCAIVSSWTVLANIIVITSFVRDPKLRVIQNYYIFSLAFTDFMMGAFVMPLGLYQMLYQAWPIQSKALCKFWNVLDFTNSMQSSLTISLISYDRYKMVMKPIAYRNEETPKRAIARIICTWCFSILFYFPVTLFWDTWQGYSSLDPDECDVEFRDEAPLTITQAAAEFLIPLSIIAFCNISLLLYIRKRRLRLVEVKKGMDHPPTDSSHDGVKAPASKIDHEAKKKNQAEIKEIRKEQKATRSLLILVGTYFILWFWYAIIGNFVMPICPTCVSNEVYILSYWPQYHISGINPLIYAVTIERFRYHFKVFFSYIMPCVRHPDKATKVGPASIAAVHSSSADK